MLKAVAGKIDELVLQPGISVTETNAAVTINNLSGSQAIELNECCLENQLPNVTIYDMAGEMDFSNLTVDYDGITIVVKKPNVPANVQAIISLKAFNDALDSPVESNIIWYTGISHSFDTDQVRYSPWWDSIEFTPNEINFDPRRLVKNFSDITLSSDLGRWLLRGTPDKINQHWIKRAVRKLCLLLANEIEADGTILFNGPPVTRYSSSVEDEVDVANFKALQESIRWITSSDRDAETRHALYSGEVARCSSDRDDICSLLSVLKRSLEGSKIAFSFGLNKQSSDALKALSDLKKSATDEAAKLNETIRGLATAVSAAVVGNLGIIIARISLPPSSAIVAFLAGTVAFVLLLYVVSVVVTGRAYISTQQDLRVKWKDKLYRYLSDDEYHKLVVSPVATSERAFRIASNIAIWVSIILFISVAVFAYSSYKKEDKNIQQNSNIIEDKISFDSSNSFLFASLCSA